MIGHRCCQGRFSIEAISDPMSLSLSQIRSVQAPVLLTCIVTNIEDSKLGLLVTIVTDIVLLLIMVVGLLYLHRYGDGKFGLAGLLRKQVRCWWFLLVICTPNVLIFLKGVFWLLLAIVTEIPPGVSLLHFLSLSSFPITNSRCRYSSS